MFTILSTIIIIETDDFLRTTKGDKIVDRMFRVLGFWTAIFSIMFFAGSSGEPGDKMLVMSLLFLAQTGFFLLLGYLRLSERMYMYIFGAYLTVFFVGFTYYTVFVMPLATTH